MENWTFLYDAVACDAMNSVLVEKDAPASPPPPTPAMRSPPEEWLGNGGQLRQTPLRGAAESSDRAEVRFLPPKVCRQRALSSPLHSASVHG
jgi:hypothetical protein